MTQQTIKYWPDGLIKTFSNIKYILCIHFFFNLSFINRQVLSAKCFNIYIYIERERESEREREREREIEIESLN